MSTEVMQRSMLSMMTQMQSMQNEINLLRTNNPQTASDSVRLEHAIVSAVTTAITSKANMTADHKPPKLPDQLLELMAKHPYRPDLSIVSVFTEFDNTFMYYLAGNIIVTCGGDYNAYEYGPEFALEMNKRASSLDADCYTSYEKADSVFCLLDRVYYLNAVGSKAMREHKEYLLALTIETRSTKVLKYPKLSRANKTDPAFDAAQFVRLSTNNAVARAYAQLLLTWYTEDSKTRPFSTELYQALRCICIGGSVLQLVKVCISSAASGNHMARLDEIELFTMQMNVINIDQPIENFLLCISNNASLFERYGGDMSKVQELMKHGHRMLMLFIMNNLQLAQVYPDTTCTLCTRTCMYMY